MRIAACSGDLVSTLLRIVTSNQKTGCLFSASPYPDRSSAHLVHAALLIYFADTLAGFEFRFPDDLIGGGVYLLIVLMVITSFDGPARTLGSELAPAA